MSNSKSANSNFFSNVWTVLNAPIGSKKAEVLTEVEMLEKELSQYQAENAKLVEDKEKADKEAVELALKAHEETKRSLELSEKLDSIADVYVANSEALVSSKKELKAEQEKFAAQKAANETLIRSKRMSALEKINLANSARLANMSVEEYKEFKASEAKADVKVEVKVEAKVPVSTIKIASLDDAKTAQAVLAKGEDLIVDISELQPELGAKLITRLAKTEGYEVGSVEPNIFCFSQSDERLEDLLF